MELCFHTKIDISSAHYLQGLMLLLADDHRDEYLKCTWAKSNSRIFFQGNSHLRSPSLESQPYSKPHVKNPTPWQLSESVKIKNENESVQVRNLLMETERTKLERKRMEKNIVENKEQGFLGRMNKWLDSYFEVTIKREQHFFSWMLHRYFV